MKRLIILAAFMMNDSTRIMRRPWRARPPTARTAAAIIATAALALLAAACSGGSRSAAGSGGSNAGGSSSSPSAVAYSACIRSHGVPTFPDPDSSGQVPKADPQGTRCQQHPAPGSPASLPAPVPEQRPYAQRQFTPAMLRIRCLPTGPGAAGGERRTEVRPVHAPTAGLGRRHRRRPAHRRPRRSAPSHPRRPSLTHPGPVEHLTSSPARSEDPRAGACPPPHRQTPCGGLTSQPCTGRAQAGPALS